jgi:hypothetical protein
MQFARRSQQTIWTCMPRSLFNRLLTNNQKQTVGKSVELWKKANKDTTFISRITLFPKLKMKLKRRRFETVSDN